MSTALAPAAVSDSLVPYLAPARRYAQASKAANTQRAYRSDWADSTRFCQAHDRLAPPAAPETVALYATRLIDGRQLKAITVTRRPSAISQAHQLAGHETPTTDVLVRTVMVGLRRVHGTAQQDKAPLAPDALQHMLAHCPDTQRGMRDCALLLVGFVGAFRRSELCALRVEDVWFVPDGLVVTVPRSKTDPDGVGQLVGIPYSSHAASCPVRVLREWLETSGITTGWLFRPVDRWTGLADQPLTSAVYVRNLLSFFGQVSTIACT